MNHIALINFENISEQDAHVYTVREAARAIVFDMDRNIALLHATKDNYYKLPGGGIESGENKIEALKRECKEEIGCDIEVFHDLGIVTEYRSKNKLKQISYCYLARVVGEKGVPTLTDNEVAEGFKTVWMSMTEAVHLFTSMTPTTYPGSYVVARELAFLKIGSRIS